MRVNLKNLYLISEFSFAYLLLVLLILIEFNKGNLEPNEEINVRSCKEG